MIKSENGVLVGYVFADIDATQRDLGGWVTDAKQVVDAQVVLPSGYRLQWTGQYEFMAETQERLKFIVPMTLVLIAILLFLALRGWGQTFLVLLSVPFAVVGSVWLLAALAYNLSTAVWVGLVAVGGVAAQTAIVIVVYLDQALRAAQTDGRLSDAWAIDAAVIAGATRCVRPMMMTVATTVLGLSPLLWGGRHWRGSGGAYGSPGDRRDGILPSPHVIGHSGRLCHMEALPMAAWNSCNGTRARSIAP